MVLDWTALSRYIPETILVVIFMIYEERRKLEQDRQDQSRDQNWRDFLLEERNERHRSGDQIAAALTAVITGLSGNHELIVKHDEWERQAQARRRNTDWQQGHESE